MRVTNQIIKQTIIIIIRTIKMIQMIPTKLTELFIFIGTPYVCYVPSELYRISYQRQTCTPLPLLSKLLPWAWVNVFFVFHDFHSHLDNSYHNRHDLSTIIIIILHHHDLKSIISFKQTRLFLTSYKNTVSARKQRLIQSNLFHHHGIRAELSQRTFWLFHSWSS